MRNGRGFFAVPWKGFKHLWFINMIPDKEVLYTLFYSSFHEVTFFVFPLCRKSSSVEGRHSASLLDKEKACLRHVPNGRCALSHGL